MLHDVQKQTAAKANIQPSLVERSPELIARFVRQYFQKLNPATQLSDSLSFVVHGARYIADVTIGKLYLTETAYKERTDQFWEFVEALRHLNQLEAEQWVDVVSHLAADMTYSFGIGKTVRYLKEIDAIGKAKRQATSVVNQLKKGLDAVLAERPIVITAEGIAVQAPKAAEELAILQKSIQKTGSAAKEKIKDSKELLKAEHLCQNSNAHGNVIKFFNMKQFFKESDFGKILSNYSIKLKQMYKGQAIYRVEKDIGEYLKKGYHFYLDKLHLDHLEVFDEKGYAKAVLNLNGKLNLSKTEVAIKQARTIKL